jgi:hypothetical protein
MSAVGQKHTFTVTNLTCSKEIGRGVQDSCTERFVQNDQINSIKFTEDNTILRVDGYWLRHYAGDFLAAAEQFPHQLIAFHQFLIIPFAILVTYTKLIPVRAFNDSSHGPRIVIY